MNAVNEEQLEAELDMLVQRRVRIMLSLSPGHAVVLAQLLSLGKAHPGLRAEAQEVAAAAVEMIKQMFPSECRQIHVVLELAGKVTPAEGAG